jgi:hypothetical protein
LKNKQIVIDVGDTIVLRRLAEESVSRGSREWVPCKGTVTHPDRKCA